MPAISVPSLILSYSLAKLHHWAVTLSYPEFSFLCFYLLISMYCVPDSCHVQCQSPEMQSEHGKPYKPALEEIPSYRPTLLVHLVACVWNDHCLPTHLQFCMFKAIYSSRPSSVLSVLLEACPPNLWPEVISSVTQLLLVKHFFSCIIDT